MADAQYLMKTNMQFFLGLKLMTLLKVKWTKISTYFFFFPL